MRLHLASDLISSFSRPPTLYTMQKVLVALMMGAAAAFQRAPIVRARVPRRISAQHHRLALREPGDAAQLASARRASSNSRAAAAAARA